VAETELARRTNGAGLLIWTYEALRCLLSAKSEYLPFLAAAESESGKADPEQCERGGFGDRAWAHRYGI